MQPPDLCWRSCSVDRMRRLEGLSSANIDVRSFSINYELNAVLYSRHLAKELEESLEPIREVWIRDQGLAARRRSMRRIIARRTKAAALRACRS